MAEWIVRETQILQIAVGRRSNPRLGRIFINSRLISIFIALSRAASCRALGSVCEAKLCLCGVMFALTFFSSGQ